MSKHPPVKQAIFIQLTGVREEDRAETLLMSVSTSEGLLISDLRAFAQIPNAPLSYWLTPRCKRIPALYQPLQSEGRAAKQGLATADDFRFLRLWWETPPGSPVSGGAPQSGECSSTFFLKYTHQIERGKRWMPFAKGGEYAPYYSDIHLVVNWENEGAEIKNNLNEKGGVRSNVWMLRDTSANYFFRPGLTWPLRTNGLSFRVVPAGCVFGHKGPCLFAESNGELLRLMAFLNTDSVTGLVHALGVGRVEIQSYEVGTIQGIPVPPLGASLTQHAENGYHLTRALDNTREATHTFIRPAALMPGLGLTQAFAAYTADMSDVRRKLSDVRAECEHAVIAAYGLTPSDVESLKKLPGVSAAKSTLEADDEEPPEKDPDLRPGVAALLSWFLGTIFGRWDLRIAIDPSLAPKQPEPFDPMPVCPSGMLLGSDGLPAEAKGIVSEEGLRARPDANTLPPEGTVKNPTINDAEYPLRIVWNGILVDDPGFEGGQFHDHDIVVRTREVLEAIWEDKSHDIERQACDILGVSELRHYFRKIFFQDHIKRYSKSRRKAPIYWQLATPSASYSVWLYYHRFNKDTFYQVLTEYVAPKLQFEERALNRVRQQYGTSPTAAQRKEITTRETFVAELADFKHEIARLAPLWNPDLNDGVIINFALLWHLVPQNKPWQKECKQVWDKLVKGDYDWAHLAMHLWPERVVQKCLKDRSLAIAHGLDETFWDEGRDGKAKPRKMTRGAVDEVIQQRTSPTVANALENQLKDPTPANLVGKKRKKKA